METTLLLPLLSKIIYSMLVSFTAIKDMQRTLSNSTSLGGVETSFLSRKDSTLVQSMEHIFGCMTKTERIAKSSEGPNLLE